MLQICYGLMYFCFSHIAVLTKRVCSRGQIQQQKKCFFFTADQRAARLHLIQVIVLIMTQTVGRMNLRLKDHTS